MKERKSNVNVYEAPRVEVIEVQIEKGFAQSMVPDTDDFGWQ